jgi:hypothetical protein
MAGALILRASLSGTILRVLRGKLDNLIYLLPSLREPYTAQIQVALSSRRKQKNIERML